MANISDILVKLIERTNQDKVDWQLAADESAYMAAFGNTSVVVSEDDLAGVIFKILNQENQVIEYLSSDYGEGREWAIELRELYSQARKIALGVGNQLDQLLQELEADN